MDLRVIFLLEWTLYFYFITTLNQVFKNGNYSKKTKFILFFCCSLSFIPAIIPKQYVPLNTFISIIITILITLLILKKSWLKGLLQGFLYVIFAFPCEALSLVFILTFCHLENVDQILQLKNGNLLIMIIYYVLGFIFITIINLILNKNLKKYSVFKFLKSKQFLGFILIIILTYIPQMALMVHNRYEYNLEFLILTIIQIIILSIYMLYSIYTYSEKEKFKEENIELQIDNKAMVSLINGVRTVKHDFNNIFQAIHGYLCVKDYDKLEKYVSSVMQECSMINNITFLNKEIFDDPGIYGVVGSKQFYANSIGILFEIDVTSKISSINFPSNQLCRVFGIILDNAIEATSKCNEKYIKLEIHHNKLKNANVIRIINTFDSSSKVDLSKIYDKGYSSKKVKSGIGLWEVKRLIDNHKKSQIYATIENEQFIQNIIIED